MNVPCPNELQDPWSPLGYRVVEIADDNAPAAESRPQQNHPAPEEEPCWSEELLEAPPVCRFVELALEEIEGATPPEKGPKRSTAAGAAKQSTPWKLRSLVRWSAVAVGLLVLVGAALALVSRRRPAAAPPAVAATLPPAAKDGLAAGPRQAADNGLADSLRRLVEDSRPVNRETFGTAVGFVRNPAEAARVAAREQKLTCLLHVSGSFEEARFT